MLPVLLVILFGIIEVGVLARDAAALNAVAREGVRAAVVGATPSAIDARIQISDPRLDSDQMITLYERRSFNEQTQTFGEWTALGTSQGVNDAVNGDQIRVTLQYQHQTITGLFPGMSDEPGGGTKTVRASVTMRRE